MSVLLELNTILTPILPVETGVFFVVPPDEYLVMTPLTDDFALFGDNAPLMDVSEGRFMPTTARRRWSRTSSPAS